MLEFGIVNSITKDLDGICNQDKKKKLENIKDRNAIFKTPVNVTTAYNKPIKKDKGTAMKGKVYGHGPLKYGFTKNK